MLCSERHVAGPSRLGCAAQRLHNAHRRSERMRRTGTAAFRERSGARCWLRRGRTTVRTDGSFRGRSFHGVLTRWNPMKGGRSIQPTAPGERRFCAEAPLPAPAGAPQLRGGAEPSRGAPTRRRMGRGQRPTAPQGAKTGTQRHWTQCVGRARLGCLERPQ
jgi:hypothetical protein